MKTQIELKELYVEHLKGKYPKLSGLDLSQYVSDTMFCPKVIQIPKLAFEKICHFIHDTDLLCRKAENLEIQTALFENKYNLKPTKNRSICMSFDFHLVEDQPKLIEVNTNASFLALGQEMYEAQRLNPPIKTPVYAQFKNDIENEYFLSTNRPCPDALQIEIADENPEQQKLFLEFLVYNQVFQNFGWTSRIVDVRNLGEPDFIYNRCTDFYFQTEVSSKLKSLYNSNQRAISPHPFEYFLFADKSRLIEWPSSPALPYGKILTPDNKEEIWAQKKSLFIKPLRSYGAKQSYKAASMSRRLFDELAESKEMLAQEYVPPGEVEILTPEGPQKFRYDLRVYTYAGSVRGMIARVYQGQVTNLKTPLGGFAAVEIV